MTTIQARAGSGLIPAPRVKRAPSGFSTPTAALARARVAARTASPGWRARKAAAEAGTTRGGATASQATRQQGRQPAAGFSPPGRQRLAGKAATTRLRLTPAG